MKKPHEKPAIIHTEKIEARAVTCSKANDACANIGPATSRAVPDRSLSATGV